MQEYRVFILDVEDTHFIQADIESWGVYNVLRLCDVAEKTHTKL